MPAAKKNKLTSFEHATTRLARRRGLYVYFEGTADHRVWRFYSTATGKELGWWCPHTSRYAFGPADGVSDDRGHVIGLAAGRL